MPTLADLLTLRPELAVLAGACLLLLIDMFARRGGRELLFWVSVVTLIAAMGLAATNGGFSGMPAVKSFNGMFVRDLPGDVLKFAICLVSLFSCVYARTYLFDRRLSRGAFHILLLFAVLGMMLLVSASSLVTLYVGLELLALSSYALVAMSRDSAVSSEAAMKYFVLGSLSSGMLLYGMSMVYGATGTLDLAAIHQFASRPQDHTLMLFGVAFLLVGIAFKFGAAPFHMWLPDVYQGAPTMVTVFIGSAPKLAAFGMAWRLLEVGAGPLWPYWQPMVAWLAVLSLVIGNVFALAQTSLKRMLAYSTISHVGFLFLGLSNATPDGYAAAMFYAIAYALMGAAGFACLLVLSDRGYDADAIDDLRGLNARSPWLALLVMLIMTSLAGVPPMLGFWAKLAVLRAAIDAHMLWLALVGAVFAVIGAFYYLRVIKVMYFDKPDDKPVAPIQPDADLRWMLSVNALLLLFLGLAWNPVMAWCMQAFGA
ncbi:MAG: NADH-quinone oxidoreductase subunit NuoN [Proteobacteria bacterium]|nr:NADH-quinone oxidoreductase subunit NuoN [Pseudomonadota bacterium]MBS0461563.1 NADH-quinone oxidoreductase subunit NuoN [Pseudomonadota bacterium]